MTTELYMDTARLGRMCHGARLAEQDFGRLVSRLRSPLYFGKFLADGFHALSTADRKRFPALRCWPGLVPFKRRFGRFVSQPVPSTYLFSTSRSLIRFAAECLFDSANVVLTTDLDWPPYLDLLHAVATRRNAALHVVRLRELIFDTGARVDDVVRAVLQAYCAHGCDGLFLSDISYLGVRLPLREIRDAVQPHRRPFLVIDGAQALGHRPVDISHLDCDLYLAGTQKWFSAYHPLRLAFLGRPESMPLIRTARGSLLRALDFDDPLLDFSEEIERNEFRTFGETVNLIPLITAAGALSELSREPMRLSRRWETRCQNVKAVVGFVRSSYSSDVQIDSELASGIVLIPSRASVPSASVLASIHKALKRYRIAATVLLDGNLRLAMPSFTLSLQHLARINAAVLSRRH